MGLYQIKRIRRRPGIRCKQKRKFKATTHSNHNQPMAENLLGQKFSTMVPNHIRVSDITCGFFGRGLPVA